MAVGGIAILLLPPGRPKMRCWDVKLGHQWVFVVAAAASISFEIVFTAKHTAAVIGAADICILGLTREPSL